MSYTCYCEPRCHKLLVCNTVYQILFNFNWTDGEWFILCVSKRWIRLAPNISSTQFPRSSVFDIMDHMLKVHNLSPNNCIKISCCCVKCFCYRSITNVCNDQCLIIKRNYYVLAKVAAACDWSEAGRGFRYGGWSWTVQRQRPDAALYCSRQTRKTRPKFPHLKHTTSFHWTSWST